MPASRPAFASDVTASLSDQKFGSDSGGSFMVLRRGPPWWRGCGVLRWGTDILGVAGRSDYPLFSYWGHPSVREAIVYSNEFDPGISMSNCSQVADNLDVTVVELLGIPGRTSPRTRTVTACDQTPYRSHHSYS